jgi:uncharacterized protein YuzE
VSVTIGGTTFDRVRYDAAGDVLYLHVGEPDTAVDFDESPEGHALRFDSEGDLVGLTIVNARWLRDQGGPVVVTLPPRVEVDPAALASALDPTG